MLGKHLDSVIALKAAHLFTGEAGNTKKPRETHLKLTPTDVMLREKFIDGIIEELWWFHYDPEKLMKC